ncbi:4-fold beta flower protein [Rhizobium aegyptiacum]|uniref:4-fold beta flower protein n=1 Tax=Rhizobium aegyptiacum TaxID=1764550 RepID=UPI0007E594B0
MDFYDRNGRATHYINDAGKVYTWSGAPVGFVRGDSVYNNRGVQVGRLHQGWIRDLNGGAVAFSDRAAGGPIPPIKQIPAIKGIPGIPPIPGIPQIPRIPAIPSLSWCARSVSDLFA